MGLSIALILKSVRRTAIADGQQRVLRYNRATRVLAVIGWPLWLVLLVVLLLRSDQAPLVAVAELGLLFLLILAVSLEFFIVRIAYDVNGIYTQSPWRPPRAISWVDVERAWFSSLMQWYVIETRAHGRVRLHVYVNGIESLLGELESRGVPVARQRAAR